MSSVLLLFLRERKRKHGHISFHSFESIGKDIYIRLVVIDIRIMNQKVFIILLPTVFIIGTFMVYRSYKSINKVSGKKKNKENVYL